MRLARASASPFAALGEERLARKRASPFAALGAPRLRRGGPCSLRPDRRGDAALRADRVAAGCRATGSCLGGTASPSGLALAGQRPTSANRLPRWAVSHRATRPLGRRSCSRECLSEQRALFVISAPVVNRSLTCADT